MKKTFYVQIELDTNKITDIITYPHEGYVEVALDVPLPPKIASGCYKLVDGSAVYVEAWDNDIATLKETVDMLVVTMLGA